MKKKQFSKSTGLPSACSGGMEWRKCPEFPTYYVSAFGDVVSARMNKRLKGFMDYDGYPAYKLEDKNGFKKQVSAHRLVAFCFISPSPSPNAQVRHLNGSRLNCHYRNLKWGAAIDNREDTRRHGTSSSIGERNPKAKLTEQCVRDIRKLHRDIKEGRSNMRVSDLAKMYGLHIATVSGIARRKTWKYVE